MTDVNIERCSTDNIFHMIKRYPIYITPHAIVECQYKHNLTLYEFRLNFQRE